MAVGGNEALRSDIPGRFWSGEQCEDMLGRRGGPSRDVAGSMLRPTLSSQREAMTNQVDVDYHDHDYNNVTSH